MMNSMENFNENWDLVKKVKWRIIDSGFADAFFNMAADEYLMGFVRRTSIPVLRFYQWEPSAITIGYAQNINEFLDIDFIASQGMDWVRRITGGEAVLHKGDLTYSSSVPENIIPRRSPRNFYLLLSYAISGAIRKLGVLTDNLELLPSGRTKNFNCFVSKSNYEVSFEGKKIVGSAQRRSNGILLQHGAIMLDVDYKCLDRVFMRNDYIVKGENELKKRLCGVNEIAKKKVEPEEIKTLILKTIEEFGISYEEKAFSANELSEIDEIAKRKYRIASWNREGRY